MPTNRADVSIESMMQRALTVIVVWLHHDNFLTRNESFYCIKVYYRVKDAFVMKKNCASRLCHSETAW